jgi:hypothetical protein
MILVSSEQDESVIVASLVHLHIEVLVQLLHLLMSSHDDPLLESVRLLLLCLYLLEQLLQEELNEQEQLVVVAHELKLESDVLEYLDSILLVSHDCLVTHLCCYVFYQCLCQNAEVKLLLRSIKHLWQEECNID